MGSPDAADWRRLRGAWVAGLATALAAAGHTLGGGTVPDLSLLLPAGAGLGWVTSGLARRPLRLPVLLAVLLAAQLGFHLLFLLAPAMPGMASGTASPPVMVGFHLLAAAGTASVLALAESAWAAVTAPARVLRLLAATPAAPVAARPWSPVVGDFGRPGAPAPTRGPASRRGPPAPTESPAGR